MSLDIANLPLVKDKYRLISLFSQGSYGPIYLAKHEKKAYSLVIKYVSFGFSLTFAISLILVTGTVP